MAQDVDDQKLSDVPLQFRLCNFGTGRSTCLSSHDNFIRTTIKPILVANPGAWIDLIGFASHLGFAAGQSETKNLALSAARCAATKTLIKKYVPAAKFNVVLPEGDAQSAGSARDDDGYWRAVKVHIFNVVRPVPPAPVPPTDKFICGPDVTKEVVETWTKIRDDFNLLTFTQKISACNAIMIPLQKPGKFDDLSFPTDLEELKKLAQQFADINSWDTLPLFQGASAWLRTPPVYDAAIKGPCATPSSDTIGADQNNPFDPKHEDENLCSNTVQINNKCWLNGTANYGTFGIMVRACNDFATTDIRLRFIPAARTIYSLAWAKMLIRAYKRFGANPEGATLPISWVEATYNGGPKGEPSGPGNRPKCQCTGPCKGNIVSWDYVWTPHKKRPGTP